MTPDITDDAIMTGLRTFLLSILPAGVEVVQGQQNRVPEPTSDDFVVMTGASRTQLSTTTHAYDPISGTNAVGRSNSIDVQLDVYGPNANDNAQTVATLFRDSYGCDAIGPGIQPLYCDDGHQMPLVNGEFQYQDRWKLTATLQANPQISTPADFATTVALTLVEADRRRLLRANDTASLGDDGAIDATGYY